MTERALLQKCHTLTVAEDSEVYSGGQFSCVRVRFVVSEMWPVTHKCLVFGQGLRPSLVGISG